MNKPEWQEYAPDIYRIKVEGGSIYASNVGLCFVPDVDLARYQSHLRDAYTQGFKDGSADAHSQYQKCIDRIDREDASG